MAFPSSIQGDSCPGIPQDSPAFARTFAAGAAVLLTALTACSSRWTSVPEAQPITVLAGALAGEGSADGPGSAARFYQPCAVARDPQGNLLVADSQNHTIRKISPSGIVTTLAGTPAVFGSANGSASAALFNFPAGLAVDPAGNVFVSDRNNVIRKITTAGVVTPVAGMSGTAGSADGPGSAAQFNNPQALAFDGAGNLYVADTGNMTIRKLAPSGNGWSVSTFAGTAGLAGSHDDTGTAARFNGPSGLALDGAGNLYVADTGNEIIRKITPQGAVSTWAGTARSAGTTDGPGLTAKFNGPAGLALDGAGNLYVADAGNQVIRKVTTAGVVVSTWAGMSGMAGSADATGSSARFRGPTGLAADPSGTLFVADFYNNTIRAITPAQAVSTLAGRPGAPGWVDGTGPGAWFNHPGRLAVDAAGNAYVPDSYNNVIRKVTPSGVVTTLAGTAGVTGGADGQGPAASFNYPRGVAVDGAGNVYVADAHNDTIRMITPGGLVRTIAGAPGVAGGQDGTGDAARFANPDALILDGSGSLYVTEYDNNTIRKLTPSGAGWSVGTVAGTAGVAGSADGTGAAASFNAPDGLALDSAGNLFVADSRNNTIRRITPAGVVSTFAGTAGTRGSADGIGSNARFDLPADLAIDASGTLYVTEFNNDTLRAVTPGAVVSTVCGVAGAGTTDLDGLPQRFSDPFGIAVDPSTGNLLFTLDDAILTFRRPRP